MIQRKAKFDREFPKHLDKSFPIESPLSRFNLAFKKSEKRVGSGAKVETEEADEVQGGLSIVVSDRNINDSQSLVLAGLEGSIASTASGVGLHNSVVSHSQSVVSNKGSTEIKPPNPSNTAANQVKSTKRTAGKAKRGSVHKPSSNGAAEDDLLDDPFFFDDPDSDTNMDDQRYDACNSCLQ
jgi:hypothetical protein